MLEKGNSGKRGKTNGLPRLTRRGRKYLHGIALAVLPVVTAAGIMTENMAALYATLIGAILVPWVALEDNHTAEIKSGELYQQGLDEGYDAAIGNDEGEEWQS